MSTCPRVTIPDEVWMLLDSVEYRKQGIMPIAGGWLDQVQIWMTAADYAMTQAAIYAKK